MRAVKKEREAKIRAMFAGAVQVKRSAKARALQTTIEREAAQRGRYERSVRRRVRHGIIPQDELDLFLDDKVRLARELSATR